MPRRHDINVPTLAQFTDNHIGESMSFRRIRSFGKSQNYFIRRQTQIGSVPTNTIFTTGTYRNDLVFRHTS